MFSFIFSSQPEAETDAPHSWHSSSDADHFCSSYPAHISVSASYGFSLVFHCKSSSVESQCRHEGWTKEASTSSLCHTSSSSFNTSIDTHYIYTHISFVSTGFTIWIKEHVPGLIHNNPLTFLPQRQTAARKTRISAGKLKKITRETLGATLMPCIHPDESVRDDAERCCFITCLDDEHSLSGAAANQRPAGGAIRRRGHAHSQNVCCLLTHTNQRWPIKLN